MSPRPTTTAAIVVAVLLLAMAASTHPLQSPPPDSLASMTQVCQGGALYLCDQYRSPPYTVAYDHKRLTINGLLYEDYDCHEEDIESRLADGTYSGFDVASHLQLRGIALRNQGMTQKEVCRRLLARADSLGNDRVSIERNDDTSFFVKDRLPIESFGIRIMSDDELKRHNDLPPPWIESFGRLVSAFAAGRPVFLLDSVRRGPASKVSDDSPFVALWRRAQGLDGKTAEQVLGALSLEYHTQRHFAREQFCKDLLACRKRTGEGAR